MKTCTAAIKLTLAQDWQCQVQVEAELSAKALGRLWVLLGLTHIQLLAPTANIDPAAEPEFLHDSILHRIEAWLTPEKQVIRHRREPLF